MMMFNSRLYRYVGMRKVAMAMDEAALGKALNKIKAAMSSGGENAKNILAKHHTDLDDLVSHATKNNAQDVADFINKHRPANPATTAESAAKAVIDEAKPVIPGNGPARNFEGTGLPRKLKADNTPYPEPEISTGSQRIVNPSETQTAKETAKDVIDSALSAEARNALSLFKPDKPTKAMGALTHIFTDLNNRKASPDEVSKIVGDIRSKITDPDKFVKDTLKSHEYRLTVDGKEEVHTIMYHDDHAAKNLETLGFKPTTEAEAKQAIKNKIMSEGVGAENTSKETAKEVINAEKGTAKEVSNAKNGTGTDPKSNALRNTLIGGGLAASAMGAGMYMRNRDKQKNNSI